jgi:hypothetical protein
LLVAGMVATISASFLAGWWLGRTTDPAREELKSCLTITLVHDSSPQDVGDLIAGVSHEVPGFLSARQDGKRVRLGFATRSGALRARPLANRRLHIGSTLAGRTTELSTLDSCGIQVG